MENSAGASRLVRISNDLGLHARAAARISQLAGKAQHSVWIQKGSERVDAASILDVLTLACPKGTEIQVIIEDPADAEVLDALSRLIEAGFGE